MGWNPDKCSDPLYHAIPIASREKKTLQIQEKDTNEDDSVTSNTQHALQTSVGSTKTTFHFCATLRDTGRCINDRLLPGVRLRFAACHKLAQIFWHFKSSEK